MDRRMPHGPNRATNVSPRFNNGAAAGRRNRRPRRNRPLQGGQSGQGIAGSYGDYANFPAPQDAPPDFLPMTPQFEAGRRGLDDQYQANKMNIINQRDLVMPQYQQAKARLDTNKGYDTSRLNENVNERGLYDSGIRSQLMTRDVNLPYGRQFSDLATNAAAQMAGYNTQLADADLAYNQGMAELLLNRAADSASNIPMNVPQYSPGGRILRGQRYYNGPQGGGGGGGHQNRNNRRNHHGR